MKWMYYLLLRQIDQKFTVSTKNQITMKKLGIDIFKISLILILAYMAFTFHEFSKNHRYQFQTVPFSSVLDTRTGVIYRLDFGDNEGPLPTGKPFPLNKPIETKSTQP